MAEKYKGPTPRNARGGITTAIGLVIGMALGSILGAVVRLVAAVAHGAFGWPKPVPSEHTGSRGPTSITHPGWTTAQPQSLLKPTYWPAVLALGIAFIMWGLTSSLVITIVGATLFILALINWIALLRHDA